MGVVYVARAVSQPGKAYAVKMLARELAASPEFRRRFFQETAQHSKLKHPNIVSVVESFEEDGDLFMVLDYIEGKSLLALIEERGSLGQEDSLRIFAGILEGLDAGRDCGVG